MCAYLMVALVAWLLIPSFFTGSTNAIVAVCLKLNSVGITAIMLAILGLLVYDKKPYMEIGNLLSKGMLWNLIFMLSAVFLFSGQINNPNSGITLFFSQALTPILATLGKWGYIIAFMLITLIGTNIVNNMVIGAIMMPLQYSMCISLGINPLVIVAMFIFVVDLAFFLPSSSPLGAMVHSNGGWIPKKNIYQWGALFLIAETLLVILVGYPIGNILF